MDWNNKKDVLEQVKYYGYNLAHASRELKNDKEVVLEAVKNVGEAYRCISEELKNDEEVILEAVKNFRDLSCLGILKYVTSEELKKNKQFCLDVIEKDESSFKYISDELKNNRDFCLEAVKRNEFILKDIPEQFKNDKEIVLNAVKKFSLLLEKASDELRNDKEVVMEAVKKDSRALRGASDELKRDKDFCKKLLRDTLKCSCIEHIDESIRNDVIYEVVKEDSSFMSHLTTYCDYLKGYTLGDIEDLKTIHFINTLQDAVYKNELDNFKEKHKDLFNDNNISVTD